MTLILILLTIGFIVGHLLRGRPAFSRAVSYLADLSIYVLLFLLGISVAATPDLAHNFVSLGLPAIVLSVSGVIGSCIMAKLVHRWIRIEG